MTTSPCGMKPRSTSCTCLRLRSRSPNSTSRATTRRSSSRKLRLSIISIGRRCSMLISQLQIWRTSGSKSGWSMRNLWLRIKSKKPSYWSKALLRKHCATEKSHCSKNTGKSLLMCMNTTVKSKYWKALFKKSSSSQGKSSQSLSNFKSSLTGTAEKTSLK